MTDEISPIPFNDILLYATPIGAIKVEVLYEEKPFAQTKRMWAAMANVSTKRLLFVLVKT